MAKRILAFLLMMVMCLAAVGCAEEEKKKSIVEEISLDRYEWGTTYDTISQKEIKKGMVEGEDYAHFEGGSEFAQELVLNTKIGGKEYRKYYDFNMDGELVSVMLVLNAVLSNEEIVKEYIGLAEAYRKEYGEPADAYNTYVEDEYLNVAEYAEHLASGEITSSYTWFDEAGNQLLLYAAQEEEYIDVILIYSSEGYNL